MPWHQLLLAFNPEGPNHWAFRRYQPDMGDGPRLDRNGVEFAEVIHVTPDDLVQYLSAQSLQRFDRMEGALRDRLRLGLWVAFEGAVFASWHPSTHVVEAPAEWARWGGYPPPDWERFRGIDLGYEPDPFACVWLAVGPDGRQYVYRQLGGLKVTVDRWAERIVEAEGRELAALREHAAELPESERKAFGPYLEALNLTGSWSDHARGERAMLDERGVWTQPADKDVTAGIQTLLELLDPRDGGPRLVVVRGCAERDAEMVERQRPASVEEEVPLARWQPESASGMKRQLPVDRDNHWLDALRYAAHSRANQAGVGVFC